jgi:RimJ/RimL family protein N-acetyltransferase
MIPPGTTHLSTDRLTLRTWTDDDVAAMLALSTDPEVMRYFPAPMTQEQAAAFVAQQRERLAAGEPGNFVVEHRETGAFLGFTGLAVPRHPLPFQPCVEVGWRLVRQAWGHGYATEAARACLDHAFDTLALDEVVSFTAVVNLPSRRVMERLGMHHDPAEDFDHPAVPSGHEVERHVLYRISAQEWRALRPR